MVGRDGLKLLSFRMVGRFRDREELEMYWDVVEVKPEPAPDAMYRQIAGEGPR
jgi:hypothetical protein